jgi:hypothetical protein
VGVPGARNAAEALGGRGWRTLISAKGRRRVELRKRVRRPPCRASRECPTANSAPSPSTPPTPTIVVQVESALDPQQARLPVLPDDAEAR